MQQVLLFPNVPYVYQYWSGFLRLRYMISPDCKKVKNTTGWITTSCGKCPKIEQRNSKLWRITTTFFLSHSQPSPTFFPHSIPPAPPLLLLNSFFWCVWCTGLCPVRCQDHGLHRQDSLREQSLHHGQEFLGRAGQPDNFKSLDQLGQLQTQCIIFKTGRSALFLLSVVVVVHIHRNNKKPTL